MKRRRRDIVSLGMGVYQSALTRRFFYIFRRQYCVTESAFTPELYSVYVASRKGRVEVHAFTRIIRQSVTRTRVMYGLVKSRVA